MQNVPTLDSDARLIVDSIPGMVALLSATGDVEVVNPQLLEYFGQTLEELRGWGTNGTVHPEDLLHVAEVFTRSISAGTPYEIVQRLRRADGVYRWIENRGFPLRDQNDRITRWCVLLTDVDKRKRAEDALQQSEHNLKLIIDTIPALVWGALPDGSAEFFNQHFLDYVGMTADQVMGWGWTVAVHPDDLEDLKVKWQDILASGQPGEAEARLCRHDGEYRWFLFRANPFRDAAGKIVKWYGQNTDIEDRKRAQEALAANERYLRSIIDTIPTHIYVLNTEGYVQHVSQAVMDYTGLTLEDLKQEDYRDRVIHPEDFRRVREPRAAGLKGGAPFSTEQRVLGADGQYRWFLVRYKPLLDEQGRIVRWYVAAFDIEDHKRAEEQVEQAYVRLADAQRLSKTGSFITDLLADDHNWSDEAYRIFEFDPGTKITARRIREVIHPEDLSLFDSVAERAMLDGNVDFGYRIVTDRGEVKHIQAVAHVVETEGRSVFVGALRDVTERMAAEGALRESERQFKTIFDEAGTGITLVDLKTGGPIRNNRALQKMLGCSEAELSKFETYDLLTHPSQREEDSASFRELCDGKRDSLRLEKHFVLKDGRSIWTNVIFTLLRDDDGHPRNIIAIHEDITERKQNEEVFRTIVETNPECVKVITRDGTLKRVNAAGVAMAGVPSEETILGQCFYDFLAPEDRDRYREFNELVCSGHKGFLEFDLINAHGQRRHMETHAAPMRSADGCVVQLGVTRDITERKRAVEKLQAKQELLDLAQTAARAMAFDWHIQEGINSWSPEQEALYGLAPGTFDGKYESWKNLIYPPDWPGILESLRHAQETGEISAEYRVIWPDRSVHWLMAQGQMFFDDQGRPARMIGFASDVTPRKLAEVQLEGEKRLLEMVATVRPLSDILNSLCSYVEETAPDCHCGFYLMDWDGPKVRLAVGPTLPASFNAAFDNFYFTPETGPCAAAAYERTQVIAADVVSDDRWLSSPFRELALAHGLNSCWSTPIYSRSGDVFGTFAVYQTMPSTPTPLQQDLIAQVTHIASIAIERSQAEEALRRSEAFLAEGQHLARLGNFAWRVRTNEITWSDQMYRIYELEPGTPVTLELIRSRVHPDDLSLYEKMIEVIRVGGDDFEWQYRLLMPNGSIKYMHALAHATRDPDGELEYIAAVQDVTARRLSQEALDEARSDLARATRVMSLGVLTASIAHEVNQPLSGIITNANTCVRMLDADPPNVDGARETARRTIRDGNRASDVITRLRALFSKKDFTAELVNLNEVAEEVVALSRTELHRSEVTLQTNLAEDLPLVDGDRVQLQQVILNLLLNAADAMSSIDGRSRELTLRTGLDKNGSVQLSVRDEGVGFGSDEAEKLFRAFYTTKKTGMGIGLSVSKSIIESHQGRLWATPNDGPGATFCFSIPCADQAARGTLPPGNLSPDLKNKIDLARKT